MGTPEKIDSRVSRFTLQNPDPWALFFLLMILALCKESLGARPKTEYIFELVSPVHGIHKTYTGSDRTESKSNGIEIKIGCTNLNSVLNYIDSNMKAYTNTLPALCVCSVSVFKLPIYCNKISKNLIMNKDNGTRTFARCFRTHVTCVFRDAPECRRWCIKNADSRHIPHRMIDRLC
jgi:hypothetical protein